MAAAESGKLIFCHACRVTSEVSVLGRGYTPWESGAICVEVCVVCVWGVQVRERG